VNRKLARVPYNGFFASNFDAPSSRKTFTTTEQPDFSMLSRARKFLARNVDSCVLAVWYDEKLLAKPIV